MSKDLWGRLAGTYDVDHVCIAGADLVGAIQSELARVVTGGEAVELGCGTGLFTPAYASRCSQVIATDISPLMLARATRAVADLPNVSTQVADAASTGLPAESADVVVAVNLLHIVPDSRAVITEIHRLLRPGGLAVLVDATGQGLSPLKTLASMVRFLRRWGPMRVKGQQDLSQTKLEALVRQAGFALVEGHLVTGKSMNAAFVLAAKPAEPTARA
jgi:ABC-2 type transport system ATP-binding protein